MSGLKNWVPDPGIAFLPVNGICDFAIIYQTSAISVLGLNISTLFTISTPQNVRVDSFVSPWAPPLLGKIGRVLKP